MKNNSKGFAPLIILVIVAVLITAAYFLGNRNGMKNIVSIGSPLPVSSSSPVATDDLTAGWKTYTYKNFSLKYPSGWSVNTGSGAVYFVELSDKSDSVNTIHGSSDKNTRLDVTYFSEQMPASFPYTNGSSDNSTIKPFIQGSLTGIKGQATSVAGLTDVVYIVNPQGGHVVLIFIPPSNNSQVTGKIFDQILSTFKFTN